MSRAVISNSVWFSLTHFRESLAYKTQDKKKAACQKFKCGKICINFSKLTNSEHGKNSVIMPEEVLGDTSEEISRLRRWKKQTAYSWRNFFWWIDHMTWNSSPFFGIWFTSWITDSDWLLIPLEVRYWMTAQRCGLDRSRVPKRQHKEVCVVFLVNNRLFCRCYMNQVV